MEQLQKYEPQQIELSDKDIQTLVQANIIPNGTPKEQVAIFGRVCKEKNLSPFSRQIYLIPRKDTKTNTTRYNIQTGIDGYRVIAERTGQYAGNDDYLFNGDRTEFELLDAGIKQPTTAKATVYKIISGLRCSFSATARWEEYYPGGTMGFMWTKMPFLMLGKVAEALALRKAFPEALGGIYTTEEMQQADVNKVVEEVKPIPNGELSIILKEFNSFKDLKEKMLSIRDEWVGKGFEQKSVETMIKNRLGELKNGK